MTWARINEFNEWIETDGLGGFASGTSSGVRTRRYHALLHCAATPPTGRFVLVNGVEAWLERGAERVALSSQRYAPGVVHPDGASRLKDFSHEPWARWTWRISPALTVEHEVFVPRGRSAAVLSWRLTGESAGWRLRVRPLMSGRDYHGLHYENEYFRFEPTTEGDRLRFSPYEGVPEVVMASNGEFHLAPEWYRRFEYEEERARGHECTEDLASPGAFTFDGEAGEAVLILHAEHGALPRLPEGETGELARTWRRTELARRAAFPSVLHRAAEDYIVSRAGGKTIIAGYPWFTDWGRDSFIALRGLCLATGRLEDARDILLAWAETVSEGMIPNRFVDYGQEAEFNAIDASLWFVVAAGEFLERAAVRPGLLSARRRAVLLEAISEIVRGYANGTRYNIGLDDDGLILGGAPGYALTWMDARIGGWVVTPRVGKPVEVQALWMNALGVAMKDDARWGEVLERARRSFAARFWNEAAGCLFDVVDVNFVSGAVDASVRPNQVLAAGGLPLCVLDEERRSRVVEVVERKLLTPLGLRSLSPDDPGYTGRYEGGPHARDSAYHQGTVWPWLLGPFVEAWVACRGGGEEVKADARQRFLGPIQRHLEEAGLGHVSEIADGEPPFTPRGCPFQAWSVGEALRLELEVLAPAPAGEVVRAGKGARGVAGRRR